MTPLSVAELTVASAARDARLQADAREAERARLLSRFDGLTPNPDWAEPFRAGFQDGVFAAKVALLSDSKEAQK